MHKQGHSLTRKSYLNTPSGSQYLRFGGVGACTLPLKGASPSTKRWRLQNPGATSSPGNFQLPCLHLGSGGGGSGGQNHSRCPKLATGRPKQAHVSRLLQPGLPFLGPEACCRNRAGRLLGTGHLQLPLWGEATALLPAMPMVRLSKSRRPWVKSGASGGRGSRRSLEGGYPTTPPSRDPARGHPFRYLPNFQTPPLRPGRVGAGSTCAPPVPTRAGPVGATHPGPGGAPLPPQRKPAPQQRRQVPQPRPRRRRRLFALLLAGAGAAAQGAVRRRHRRRRGQGRALARRLHLDGAHGHPHALTAAAAPAALLPRARLRAQSAPSPGSERARLRLGRGARCQQLPIGARRGPRQARPRAPPPPRPGAPGPAPPRPAPPAAHLCPRPGPPQPLPEPKRKRVEHLGHRLIHRCGIPRILHQSHSTAHPTPPHPQIPLRLKSLPSLPFT